MQTGLGAALGSIGQSLDPLRFSQAVQGFQQMEDRRRQQEFLNKDFAQLNQRLQGDDKEFQKLYSRFQKLHPQFSPDNIAQYKVGRDALRNAEANMKRIRSMREQGIINDTFQKYLEDAVFTDPQGVASMMRNQMAGFMNRQMIQEEKAAQEQEQVDKVQNLGEQLGGPAGEFMGMMAGAGFPSQGLTGGLNQYMRQKERAYAEAVKTENLIEAKKSIKEVLAVSLGGNVELEDKYFDMVDKAENSSALEYVKNIASGEIAGLRATEKSNAQMQTYLTESVDYIQTTVQDLASKGVAVDDARFTKAVTDPNKQNISEAYGAIREAYRTLGVNESKKAALALNRAEAKTQTIASIGRLRGTELDDGVTLNIIQDEIADNPIGASKTLSAYLNTAASARSGAFQNKKYYEDQATVEESKERHASKYAEQILSEGSHIKQRAMYTDYNGDRGMLDSALRGLGRLGKPSESLMKSSVRSGSTKAASAMGAKSTREDSFYASILGETFKELGPGVDEMDPKEVLAKAIEIGNESDVLPEEEELSKADRLALRHSIEKYQSDFKEHAAKLKDHKSMLKNAMFEMAEDPNLQFKLSFGDKNTWNASNDGIKFANPTESSLVKDLDIGMDFVNSQNRDGSVDSIPIVGVDGLYLGKKSDGTTAYYMRGEGGLTPTSPKHLRSRLISNFDSLDKSDILEMVEDDHDNAKLAMDYLHKLSSSNRLTSGQRQHMAKLLPKMESLTKTIKNIESFKSDKTFLDYLTFSTTDKASNELVRELTSAQVGFRELMAEAVHIMSFDRPYDPFKDIPFDPLYAPAIPSGRVLTQ